MFQHSKNIKNVFGTCVYFCKKNWTYVQKIIFLIWTELPISLRCSSSLPLSLLFPHHMTKPLHSKISIDATEHPRLSFTVVGWASRSSVYVRRSNPRSSFCRRRPITPRSRFESHFHLLCQWVLEQRVKSSSNWEVCFLVFVFCFLFLFFVTNRENPFFLFFVCCWDGALIYNPNIDALHSRNL